jgi:hypothetical protein
MILYIYIYNMTQVYTRGVSSDFPNGIVTDQLMTEINNVMSVPILSINIDNGVVNLIFASQIEDEAQLNTIIENHMPITRIYTNPYIVNDVIKHTIGGTEYSYFGNNPFEITISNTSQAQYTSITEAIAANNAPNNVFIVSPGTYIENNPIILPPGSSLKSNGTASNTTIIAQNSNSDLVTLREKCYLTGCKLVGATGARGIYFDATLSHGQGTFSVVAECFIIDCNIGIECDGKNFNGITDTLYCDKLVIQSATLPLSKGVYCHNTGQFIGTTVYVVGVPGYFPITTAYHCTDPLSKISLIGGSAWFCGTGLLLNNSCLSELSLLTLNYNYIAAQIGSVGTTTKLSVNSLSIQNSVAYDISILAANANIQIYSSYIDDSKIYNPNRININIKYNATKYGRYYQAILGDLQIGSPSQPSKLAVGEGLYINNGLVIFNNTYLESGTWSDNTIAALSYNVASFNLFPTGAANECLYFGSDYDIFGFKINIITCTTTITQLNDIIWEYWDGTSWLTFNVMQTYPDYPCYTYVNSFVSFVSKFSIRFGLTTNASFAIKTLNSASKKWIRLRIVNSLSNVPAGEYVKIHTNTTMINNDGYTEYYGNARIVKNLAITDIYSSNSSPTDNEIFIAKNLSIGLVKNVFTDGTLTRIGFCHRMATDIDISFPIKLNLAFIVNNPNVGNINFTLRYGFTTVGNAIFLNSTDAPTDGPNTITMQHIVNVASNTNNIDLRTTISMDVHTIPPNPSSGAKYIIFISLERNAIVDNTVDTYDGNVYLLMIDSSYVSWCDGGHLLGF